MITERLLTHGDQHAESDMEIDLNGEDCRAALSRSVAQDTVQAGVPPRMVGNAKCFGHSSATPSSWATPTIIATPSHHRQPPTPQLIHEAAIGKIAGEQLLKLETLGLTRPNAS